MGDYMISSNSNNDSETQSSVDSVDIDYNSNEDSKCSKDGEESSEDSHNGEKQNPEG